MIVILKWIVIFYFLGVKVKDYIIGPTCKINISTEVNTLFQCLNQKKKSSRFHWEKAVGFLLNQCEYISKTFSEYTEQIKLSGSMITKVIGRSWESSSEVHTISISFKTRK